MTVRLDKLLSSQGLGSRRDIKRLLRARELRINGSICRDSATSVDPETDILEIDGQPFTVRNFVYLMLNKPDGVITSTEDPGHRTVMDLLTPPWNALSLFPVGRLDKDTEGLLILTNDGPLTHRLTSPKTGVDKTYYAELALPCSPEMIAEYCTKFRDGLVLGNGMVCLPAGIAAATAGIRPSRAAPPEAHRVVIVIQEGKYHQVKKMCRAVGNEVRYLRRIAMGNLALDSSLQEGSWRELTETEIQLLRGAQDGEN